MSSELCYQNLLIPASRIRRKRPSLRIIVSSATLDVSTFLDYFKSGNSDKEATIISLEGRLFPVEVVYSQEPVTDYVYKAAEVAFALSLQVWCFDKGS